ncbi:MAG: 4-hydroxy-tetrahydrodipicolinate synthase [Bacteroidales bacterium]|nr:4-hydroxy-tetrahydrodipicolinate synthase [Bacteroidales bacterium]
MTEKFTGTGVALVTPFDANNNIDFKALERIINHVINEGVEFIVALGTTGENSTLGDEEKPEVVKHVIDFTNKRVPVVVGIGGNNTASVVKKINTYNLDNVAGILTVAPYYNKPTQQGLYQHFSSIAVISPRPVILYNVPGRTSSNIEAKTVLQLARDHSNIVAVKEASGNMTQIMQIIKNKPPHFEVLSGDDAMTLPMIYLGAKGVISVVANSHPKMFSEMVRAALENNRILANQLHYNLLDYYTALFREGNPAGIKSALSIMKMCRKDVRLPLVQSSEQLDNEIAQLIKKIG